jgi:hypothetical protein
MFLMTFAGEKAILRTKGTRMNQVKYYTVL